MRFALSDDFDAALRPVHIRNVGIPIDEPIDGFWRGVMDCVGIDDVDYMVQSFVDGQKIRAYFNSHSYCVRPSIRLFRKWLTRFEKLACNKAYQTQFCSDELHRIFLHQAVLSALTVAMIQPERIEILPATYSYPYNLQKSVPTASRAAEMNQLVSVVYESLSLDPDRIEGLEIQEPLRSWLAKRIRIRSE